MRTACPCCEYLTLDEPYDVCLVCWWEDDPDQSADPELAGGANQVCLRVARENYRKIGASEPTFVDLVRTPTAEETPARSP
ncbi:MAG TPA: CPCC family cysteine-rich protein [Kofleriaceae bacterium]